jgi:acetylornithine deacetylase/succinyl-diaminopimelate desuccinylase-like protein
MSREAVIERLRADFDGGDFQRELARRVAIPTESQVPESSPHLRRYLAEEIGPELATMGYEVAIHDNPEPGAGPFLIGRRMEDPARPTVLTYGHGDVVRGLAGHWREQRDPWTLEVDGDRIYGRGVVDNKGQHTINMRALRAVIETRGRLGFNSVFLMETGEETGSQGIHAFCAEHREALAADILIASDGPRLAPHTPTLFMGTRGALNLDLILDLRDNGHHSGNWGGLLANPGIILANAIASIVDEKGRVKLRELVPEHMPNSVRAALGGLTVEPGENGPTIDEDWGEPGLTSAEKVFGWNTFEVLAFTCGNPDNPVNAVPPNARAHCQIRYTVDRDRDAFIPAIRAHLDAQGYGAIEVRGADGRTAWAATRLDPEHPYVDFAARSIERTLGKTPARLPNLGGSLPNDAFAHVLGLPTVYVPHSYAGCSQHAPNEHGLGSIFREGLAMMGGLFWDLGEQGLPEI